MIPTSLSLLSPRTLSRLSIAVLVLAASSGVGRAQTHTEVNIQLFGSSGVLGQELDVSAGTWTATGGDAGTAASASVTISGMGISSVGSGTNLAFQGTFASITAEVSDLISISSASATGNGHAVLRFRVGEAFASNGVSLGLSLRGGGDTVHLSEYPIFDDHFSTGIVEFAHEFSFSGGEGFDHGSSFVVSLSFHAQAAFNDFAGLSAQSWDFSQGATFLGVSAVFDSSYNLVTDFAVSSLSGADYSVSAIPEPSTYAVMAGVGALGLALLRRRGRRA
jgi:PEP-CTERM putative exosortase interaction domain